jgi:hypothetical protein
MTLKRDDQFVRRDPAGDVWDSLRVVAPSPTHSEEWVIAPTDAFGEASTVDPLDPAFERSVTAVSTSEEQLLAAYEHVGE